MVNPRLGNQNPTFEVVGEYAYSDGAEAICLFREYGATFYPSQEYEMELFLARNEDDSFAALSIGIAKPRQNGKSYSARWYALWEAMVEGKSVLFTAHHGTTVRKMFKELCKIIEGCSDIKSELIPVNGIYRSPGLEGIYFQSGGFIEFQTRTASGGRGGTYDIIIVDEAQELTEDQNEALIPTSIAAESGDPQIIYLGTPPGPKCFGTVFKSMHDKAHEGTNTMTWWLEWSVEDVPDMTKPEDVLELAYKTNPALGYRIRERTMMKTIIDASSPFGFAREYLGWWAKKKVIDTVLDFSKWKRCATKNPPKQGIIAFGVKFSLDGRSAYLAVCRKPTEGNPHVEIVKARKTTRGIAWLVNDLVSCADKTAVVVIDGQAKSALLEKKLLDAGLRKKQVKVSQPKEMSAACSMLDDAVSACAITHFDQLGLNESVQTSTRRKIGSQGGWGFDGVNPLAVEAIALALYGATTTKRNPDRKMRLRC